MENDTRSPQFTGGESGRLAELLDRLPVLYFVLDRDGQVAAIHPRLAAEQGQPRAALSGMHFTQALPRYAGTALERACFQALRTGEAQTLEWREPSQAGWGGKWYAIHIEPLSAGGVGVFFHDITAEKDLRLTLDERNQLLDAINQVNPAVLYRIDVKRGYPLLFNKEVLERLGYAGSLFGKAPHDMLIALMHPDDLPRFNQHLDRLSAQPDGAQETFEFRLRDAQGRYHWYLSRDAVYRRDASGAVAEILGSALEITEMKETIQALRLSESTFHETFENASVGISHVGMDGRWLMVNQRLCEITGYTRDALLGMRFQDISHPDDLALDLEQFALLTRGAINGYQMEKRYFHKDGHLVWIHISISLQRDADGAPLYCISVIQDITARKRLEAQDHLLIEIGDLLAQAQTENEAVVQALERLGSYLGVDRALLIEPNNARHTVRFYPDYHLDLPSLEGIYPLRGVLAAIQDEMAAGKQVVIEDSATDPHTAGSDASLVSPYKLRAYVFTTLPRDPGWQGALVVAARQPRCWQPAELALLHSVSHLLWPALDKLRLLETLRKSEADLRQSEITLRESEQNFRQALERSGLVNFHQDLDLRYTWLHNPLNLYPEVEPLGKTDAELFLPEDAQAITELKRQVLRSGQGQHTEIRLHLGGRLCYFDVVLEPSYDALGAITGLVGSVLDVTARREAEEAIVEYMRKLERSNQDLQDFAFIASHDLQEPLRKVITFGERLKDHDLGNLDAESRDFLARMINATERMRKMIDDLLAYSRVATKAGIFAPVDLAQVAQDVLADLETRIEDSGGSVEVAGLPVIDADALQMHQLLLNLVSNALKFHRPDQPPRVQVSARPLDADLIELRVADNGIGFDTQFLNRIFQPFARLQGRSEYEGSGIGLAICRRIVERHGGSITAESVPGAGSTFIARLPVRH
ncbi:MAG TPA: PAS domain S-box protein [Anaerolineaceae bacterium]